MPLPERDLVNHFLPDGLVVLVDLRHEVGSSFRAFVDTLLLKSYPCCLRMQKLDLLELLVLCESACFLSFFVLISCDKIVPLDDLSVGVLVDDIVLGLEASIFFVRVLNKSLFD